jgi:hypothetical protein
MAVTFVFIVGAFGKVAVTVNGVVATSTGV